MIKSSLCATLFSWCDMFNPLTEMIKCQVGPNERPLSLTETLSKNVTRILEVTVSNILNHKTRMVSVLMMLMMTMMMMILMKYTGAAHGLRSDRAAPATRSVVFLCSLVDGPTPIFMIWYLYLSNIKVEE